MCVYNTSFTLALRHFLQLRDHLEGKVGTPGLVGVRIVGDQGLQHLLCARH
jgi:hypothetical protein